MLDEPPLIEAKFNIADSVGPLISSAVLVEKLDKSKDDTIYITFTEKVNNIEGKSLKLIRTNNNGEKVSLEVTMALTQADGSVKVVIKSLGDKSPKEGDSLYIESSGPIIDANNNHAHKTTSR